MADDCGKTEQPTPRRLLDARKKGDVLKSPAVGGTMAFAAAILLATALAGKLPGLLRGALVFVFSSPPQTPPVAQASSIVSMFSAWIVAPPIVFLLLAAGASIAQTGMLATTSKIGIGEGRYDPGAAIRRLFDAGSFGSAAVSFLGAAAVVVLGVYATMQAGYLCAALYRSTAAPAFLAGTILSGMAWKLCAAGVVFATIDLLLKARSRRKRLMMSTREVREELKESEGDPFIKSKRRRLHRQLVMNPLKQSVRGARVVLVNPTHLAVALRYDEGDDAPVIAFKGEGPVAARMISEAHDASVPVVRDILLARSIYFSLDVEDEISPELYDAVASVFRAAARAASEGVSVVTMD
jgi:flagellar biosynthesis protein FlhB